ncbi:MAG: vitamin K epoxide reductase family protein [Polyangiaceae bacterium]|nr:vitamin K epoxide reductase family protein [Polyangiaceae bacterium]
MLQRPWRAALLGLVGSLLGLTFAALSTTDYAAHLDRGVHDLHCSLIIGAPPTSDAEACRAAMYSPYSAVLKDTLWGGLPISLFALGAFGFFAGYSLYVLLAGTRVKRPTLVLYGLTALTPLLASALMFTISMIKLGSLCKVCVGIYVASALLGLAGVLMLSASRSAPKAKLGEAMAFALAGLTILGVFTLLPAVVYAASAPNHTPYLANCGKIARPATAGDELITLQTPLSKKSALLFEDPMCPTCKAFHERLVIEGVFDRLDAKLSLFPLDSECNWMLSDPLHPGACIVARAILCTGNQAREAMDWAYKNQEALVAAGKRGPKPLEAMLTERFGLSVGNCMNSRETKVRLNKHLHFASENKIPVSTPQVFLGDQKLCEEDTDIGLKFTLSKLAPEVLP